MDKPVDIYNGRDPNTLPLFTYAEVARWLRMPPSTVRDRIKANRPDGEKRGQVSFLELYDLWNESNRPNSGHFEHEDPRTTSPVTFHPGAGVTINPRVQFGRPTSSGTGITTSMLVGRVEAGESVKAVAEDYGIEQEAVAAAVRFEDRMVHDLPQTEEEMQAMARRFAEKNKEILEALGDD